MQKLDPSMDTVKIFSIHAKRTDFLKLHVESLRYFCEDNFEYYCIDNFLLPEHSQFIKKECEELCKNNSCGVLSYDSSPLGSWCQCHRISDCNRNKNK